MDQPQLTKLLIFLRPFRALAAILVGFALLLGACDIAPSREGGPEADPALVKTIPPATLTAISADAEAAATQVPDPLGVPWSALDGVEIDFWYIWDLDEPGIGMNAIVDRFNLDNPWGIEVQAVDQGLSLDPIQSIEAAFAGGVVPQVMVSDAAVISGWYQAGLLADLTPLIEDPAAGLSSKEQDDYYPGIFDPFTLDGDVRPGLPFTQTVQVIFYNSSWARELGFSSPPLTSADLLKQGCRAASQDEAGQPAPTGLILYPDAASVTSWIYAYQGLFQDARKADYQFTEPEIRAVARAWLDLQEKGCGSMISPYPNPMAREMEFEHFNQRNALMVMASALDLEQVNLGANQTGRPDDWDMIPFLGPDGQKAVASEVQAGVVFHSTPEQELASWMFLKYLTSPEVQAEWVQYSFLYPTRMDSLFLLRAFRTENPGWSRGLNLLKYARIQPVDPSWPVVKQALGDAFEAILADEERNYYQILTALDQTAAELRELSGE